MTLVEAPGERCDRRAFLIESHLLGHLDQRERNGYERHAVDIGLGDAPVEEIAEHINRCAGSSGTNVE